MKYPNFEEEKILWRKGFEYVVGLDEAGRGPLAGPVVAGAVLIKKKDLKIIEGINDSKKLSEKQRDYFYNILTTSEYIEWGVGIVSEKIIDKINILEASKLAMQKAISNLSLSFPQKRESRIKTKKLWIPSQAGNDTLKIGYLLLDGNFRINSAIPQKSIIKGDTKVISIAGASIIAKVTRDRIMMKYHKKYPQYGFDKHKGYPTEMHVKMLHKIGACPIHRKSFSYPQLRG